MYFRKGHQQHGQKGAHGHQHQHHVVTHSKPKEKHHDPNNDPIYLGTGEIKQHQTLSDNLTK
jgi:hypothetical protein